MDMENGASSPVLLPCSVCSRTFLPNVLGRHEKICKKTSEKKRKVFNSSKQRTEDSEIGLPSPSANKSEEGLTKMSNWREKHEELIRNIRANRGEVAETSKESTPPKKNVPSDYIQCPSCGRHFNKKAAERHITWCQSQKAQIPRRSTSTEAKERLQARTRYKAPTPGKKWKEDIQNRKSPKAAQNSRENAVKCTSPESNGVIKKTARKDSAGSCWKSRNLCFEKPVWINEDAVDEDDYNLLQKLVDLNTSIQANSRMYGNINSSWNNKMSSSNCSLPEVSSCDETTQSWPSKSCWGSNRYSPSPCARDARNGAPERLETLPASPMPLFCCHCGSKYPISSAKYCSQCGAKRRAFGPMTFQSE